MFSDVARPIWLYEKSDYKPALTFLSFTVLILWHTSSEQNIHLSFQLGAYSTQEHTECWLLNRCFQGNPVNRINPT